MNVYYVLHQCLYVTLALSWRKEEKKTRDSKKSTHKKRKKLKEKKGMFVLKTQGLAIQVEGMLLALLSGLGWGDGALPGIPQHNNTQPCSMLVCMLLP